ncbi:hypothetical protein [Planococcus sp. ISL-109]|uniref:hypothetical protein n=1 Tax=Planococcus sp. ISL-109 TaxID=2819166 RepID=UPI001BE840C5|nr:hypothetical protein [Planococcus sp. ISL-109]MBT2582430.1 hypothetical protein [Planococcus sp. ISL-109]
MIKLLIWVILAAAIMTATVFLGKAQNKKKMYIIAIGSLFAAAIALWMQGNFAWHMSFLAILGLSLVTALLYMKVEEREQLEKDRLKAERQALRNQVREEPKQAQALKQPEQIVEQPAQAQQESPTEKPEKVFGMESIGPVGKGN